MPYLQTEKHGPTTPRLSLSRISDKFRVFLLRQFLVDITSHRRIYHRWHDNSDVSVETASRKYMLMSATAVTRATQPPERFAEVESTVLAEILFDVRDRCGVDNMG